MLHYWEDFTTVSLPEFPLFAQYLQTTFKVCEQLSLPLHPAKCATPINYTLEHLWARSFSLPIALAAQNLPFRLCQPMFTTVHWQQGAKSLVHEGGSVALTCSPLGQGIAGTLTSAVSKWLVVLQLMFQLGGFPLAFVCSAWLWFGGSQVPLCPIHSTSSLQGPWRRWEFPMAGSRSQRHNGNFLQCLIFAWGPYQPFLVPFNKIIYWWWV